jgi:hypothetical protein
MTARVVSLQMDETPTSSSALVEIGFYEVVAEFSGGIVLVDEGFEVGESGVLSL